MDKCAQDLLAYQEIIHGVRPDYVIETGVRFGGSCLFFADMCELTGRGQVVGVDTILPVRPPVHPRLTLIEGSSVDPKIFAELQSKVWGLNCFIVLDSDHSTEHVMAELDTYSPLIQPGGFLVVEDTNTSGPAEALAKWLPKHPEFGTVEGPYISFAPGGYLQRK